ncbi:MAG TPA: tetratricopeptide repeat protein [Acidimicrobiales bacterium]|nr:tetratricopeptide repeat protein [Acidimicrobiales bacterium]
MTMQRCAEPGCTGRILADGYCDTCGTKAPDPTAVPAKNAPGKGLANPAVTATPAALVGAPAATLETGSTRSGGSRRTVSGRTRTTTRRSAIGAGIVEVPPAPAIDPATIVMANPEVAEEKRFCSNCGAPVGRSKGRQPGRLKGFCPRCRNAFDFVPKLEPGDLVGRQYEIVGALAHGGLGWIYLARDKAVNDRWSVLKGLLDAGDEAAMAVAVAERRYLAEIDHPNIVEIFNFVTHAGAGYIVMEYVGGPSLKQILKQRREANNGQPDPLPVDQAIAYVLAILPAFAYLHRRGLVYCDFKPDNLIQVGDQVKLIDLGGVRRLDDPSGDVYGTVGFQAPEIADLGPSVASDVYTIGRTLAVLTMDFKGYQSTYQHTLPDPAEHPALADHPSFHRLLLKSTAKHPDDRFQSVPELSDQLVGVLREVVAVTTGTPQPGPSAVFAGAPEDDGLPVLTVDPADPAAGFVANLANDDPADVLRSITDALALRQVTDTVELRLRRVRAHVDLGRHDEAASELARIEADDPWEWRASWLRGVMALAADDAAGAVKAFDRCLFEVPGELAPKLAAAIAAERAGDVERAAALYDVVSTVDPSYVGAATGLARCRLKAGDVPGALAAFSRVPSTHRAHGEAQLEAVRALVGADRFAEAGQVLERLQAAGREAAQLDVELFEAALRGLTSGAVKPQPSVVVRGQRLDEEGVRQGLERAYRTLAKLSPDDPERWKLVDRANQVRPLSLV